MRSSRLLHALCLALGAAGSLATGSAAERAPALDPSPQLIRNANVVTGEGETLREHDVLVVDGHVAAIGPSGTLAAPKEARVHDVGGFFLAPGLVDMHVHLPPDDGAEGGASFRALTLLLANGVTTARGLAGHPSHVQVRDDVIAGKRLGPMLYVAGPPLHDGVVTSAVAATIAVRAHSKQDFDLVKSHEISDPQVHSAVLDEARQEQIPVAGHVHHEIDLEHAIERGQQVEHLDGFVKALLADDATSEPFGQFPPLEILHEVDESKLAPLAKRLAEKQAWVTPTLALFEHIADPTTPLSSLQARPELRYCHPKAVEAWSAQRAQHLDSGLLSDSHAEAFTGLRARITKALADEGLPLLAGSDSPQAFLLTGFALHYELEALQHAGLTPAQCLAAATSNPAQYLRGLPDEGSARRIPANFGFVKLDLRADFVLLRADPTLTVSNLKEIEAVMVRGRWLDRGTLDAMLEDVEGTLPA